MYGGGGGGGGGLWAVSKVEGSACIPRLPGSILLVGFSDTLPVASILGMVYMIAICGCFCSPEGGINGSCGRYGSFSTWDSPFWAVGGGGGLWALSKVVNSVFTPGLPRCIPMLNFSDTLLVVLILDIVYDCHLCFPGNIPVIFSYLRKRPVTSVF